MAKFKFKGLEKLLSKLNPKSNAKSKRSKPGTQSNSKQNLGSKPEFNSNTESKSNNSDSAFYTGLDRLLDRLNLAAKTGDLPTVRALWAESKDDKGHEERTLRAFMTAVANSQTDVVLLFLQEFGVDPNMSNKGGESALARAVRLGDGKTVRILIENRANPFIGKQSPFELAKALWTPKAFGLLEDLIKEIHPKLIKVNDATDRDEENQKKTRDMHTKKQHQSHNSDHELWPDRVFIRQGTKTYLPPSEPSYWY